MAGEVQGSIFEAITRVALERAITGNRRGWKVLFHQKPTWISIEPDIAVGKDKDNIEILLLVTHTISERMSEKKFWRNIAELFQWKVQGPKPVRVVDVVFVSKFKPELMKVSEAVMDAVLDLGQTTHGRYLIDYIKEHANAFGSSAEARYEKANALCDRENAQFDRSFAGAVSTVAEDLKNLLIKDNAKLATLWALQRQIDHQKRPYPKARATTVRNGLAKLMLLEPELRKHVYPHVLKGTEIPFNAVPGYAISLGLVFEDIDTARVDDKDIQSVIKMLGQERCEDVIARIPARMVQYISILRAAENNRLACAFGVKEFARLSTAAGMQQALLQCYDSPGTLLANAGKVVRAPVDNWLFVYCMTIDKVRTGRVVSYGLSNLAEETGIPQIGSLGGVLITPFINREKPLKPEILKAVSKVFSDKFKELGDDGVAGKKFQDVMCDMLLQRQMYTLSVYRFFDPIGDLIKIELEKQGVSWKEVMVPTCLREYVGAQAAKTGFMEVGKEVLIHWQTVTEAGRVHKVKELSARFRATKVQWNGTEFNVRPKAKCLYFVADGDWRDEDLEMLSRSGATEIFYPDDVQRLADKVKTRPG